MKAQDRLRLQVRDALTDANMSQAAAARALGITSKHMSQMMTGKARLNLDWAERILGLCGMTVRTTLIVTPAPEDLTYQAIARGWDE